MACRLSATSRYLNQCLDIVNLTLRNKFQWNLHRSLNIFIKENAFENVVWKMAAILSRPQCVTFGQSATCLNQQDHWKCVVHAGLSYHNIWTNIRCINHIKVWKFLHAVKSQLVLINFVSKMGALFVVQIVEPGVTKMRIFKINCPLYVTAGTSWFVKHYCISLIIYLLVSL